MKFLHLPAIAALQNPFYILDPVLPERSLVLVHGHPGLGKSTLVLGWLMSVAHGEPWLDTPVQCGQVVNVWTEGHYGDVKKRHWAALEALGGDPTARMGVEEATNNYRWVPEPVNLLDQASVSTFVEELDKQAICPKVLSFDSFHMCSAGAEENSGKDMGIILGHLAHMRDLFGCSIVLVHHSRKDGETERGHTSLKAAVDVQVAVKGDPSEEKLTVKSEKVRGGPPFRLTLYRSVVQTPWGTSVSITEDRLTPDEEEQAILDYLRDREDVPTADLVEALNIPRRTLHRKLKTLEGRGFVVNPTKGKWMCHKNPISR